MFVSDNASLAACESYRLSPAQEGMLHLSLVEPEAGAYVHQLLCHVKESLDIPIFLECWRQVVNHHSILRTFFRWEDLSEPRQFVAPAVSVPVTENDWRGLCAEERAIRIETFLGDDRRLSLELARAPVMRLALFRLGDAEYQVLWTVHHLLVDGRSMRAVLQQVFARYEAGQQGRAYELPDAPPYGAYVAWLEQQPTASAEAFWRKHLAGLSGETALTLPARDIVPGVARVARQAQLRIEKSLTTAVETFAASHGLTLNIVLMGAWALLLHRYNDGQNVVFGATKAVRNCPAATPSSVGVFINTLPVRTHVDADTRLVPWLAALRKQWISFREFEHTAPGMLRACSGLPGDTPLFGTCYVFERLHLIDSLRALGDEWREREIKVIQRTPLPIILAGYGGESLDLAIEYDGRYFDEDTVSRILEHLRTVLQGMVANPDARLEELPLLTERDRRQLLAEWQPAVAPPPPTCICHLVEAVASQTPDAPAVRFADAILSYRELNRRANQFAHYLRKLGVTAEARVGICMTRSLDMIVALLGILKAGGAYVPLDSAYPTERLEFMLSDSQASVLVTERGLLARFGALPSHVVCIEEESAQLAQRPQDALPGLAAPDDLAYIIYTSGSTGLPKGVMIERGAMASLIQGAIEVYGISSSDRVLQFASLSFDAAVEEIFVSLCSGAELVLRTEDMISSAAGFLDRCREWGVTILDLPTAYWHALVDQLDVAPLPDCVRQVIIGSEAARADKVALWQARVTRSVRLINAYGPTETTVTATWSDLSGGLAGDEVPIGRPMPNARAYVLDSRMRLAPVGVPGELCIGGPQLARGYLGRTDLTAQAFVQHPFEPNSRVYKTGDRVRWQSDGQLVYLGRFDRQVKIRGYRIELGELEHVLQRHPAVKDAAVEVSENPEGDRLLVAYVVPADPAGRTDVVAEVRSFLRAQLPGYMQPPGWVVLERLPMTPTGKIDRRALPAPEKGAFAAAEARVAPRTDLERVLVNIWREVLKVGEFGIHDNFFDLGGHSLLAIQVISRVRDALQLDVPLRRLFEAATVAAFALSVEEALFEEVEALSEDEAAQRLAKGRGA